MDFSELAPIVEPALGQTIVSSTPYPMESQNEVFQVRVGDDKGEVLYVKYGPDLAQEEQGNALLSSLGLATPAEKLFIPDALNGKDILITELVRGVSLAELCAEDPDQAVALFLNAYVEFRKHTADAGIMHGDFVLPNVIAQNISSDEPSFVFLDNGAARKGNAWEDLSSIAYTIDRNTKKLAPMYSSDMYEEYFFRGLRKENRKLFLDCGIVMIDQSQEDILEDPMTWKTLLKCYQDDAISYSELCEAIPALS